MLDDNLNRQLIDLLKRKRIQHSVGKDGVIRYSPDDEELVENELIRSIRDSVFKPWQIISCPKDWAERYKSYMSRHEIPFVEELIDRQLCFLIPRKYRPHSWRLRSASMIRITKIEQGKAKYGCSPSGVQVFFKDNPSRGNPKMMYLHRLLKDKGFQTKPGHKVRGVPFYYLCIWKQGVEVKPDDVLPVLRTDPEIDLNGVDQEKGKVRGVCKGTG
jgi:hypothetical protein